MHFIKINGRERERGGEDMSLTRHYIFDQRDVELLL